MTSRGQRNTAGSAKIERTMTRRHQAAAARCPGSPTGPTTAGRSARRCPRLSADSRRCGERKNGGRSPPVGGAQRPAPRPRASDDAQRRNWRRTAARRSRAGQSAVEPLAAFDHASAALLKPGFVLQRGDGAGLGGPAERIGVEAVLHPGERLDQVGVADRIADPQARPAPATWTWSERPAGSGGRRPAESRSRRRNRHRPRRSPRERQDAAPAG